MTPLAEKQAWGVGTRVIYNGDFGPVPCMMMAAPYLFKSVWRVGINSSFVRDLSIDLADLELAPTFETTVRWEVRYVDEWKRDIIVYRGNQYTDQYSELSCDAAIAQSIKLAATRERGWHQKSDTENRTFRRVKVTVTKKVKP